VNQKNDKETKVQLSTLQSYYARIN
jgi:hypothetical protein